MPYISVQLSSEISPQQAKQLSHGVTEIMGSILSKKTELTAVNISYAAKQHWSIDSVEVNETEAVTAFIDARISGMSNSDDDKKTAIAALYALLEDVLGSISEVSYVVITEIPMTDWGYGGRTQHDRFIKKTASGNIDTDYYQRKGRFLRANLIPRLSSFFR